MQLVVKLSRELAASLRSGSQSSELHELREFLEQRSLDLKPVFPTVAEGELGKMFSGTVDDSRAAFDIAAQLRELRGVEGAFVKPLATPP